MLREVILYPDLEFSRLESWSRDVSRPIFTSLALGLGLEPRSLGLGLGLGTLESRYRSWSWDLLEKIFCPPATSAPVERIFSHSGLLMRANRARMDDNVLSQLV